MSPFQNLFSILLFMLIPSTMMMVMIDIHYIQFFSSNNKSTLQIKNATEIMDVNEITLNNQFDNVKDIPCNLYRFRSVPKRTFTYWLSHIESQHRLTDKAKFSDKFLMKQYIINYTKTYPLFNQIHHTKLFWDFHKDGTPSFQQLTDLKKKHKAFLVKPNHTSGKQIVIHANDMVTRPRILYRKIMRQSQKWLKNEHKRDIGRTKREPWYRLITPRVFIEENINIDINYPLITYKLFVVNYKALFMHIYPNDDVKNLYTLPDIKWLNVTLCKKANKTHTDPIPLKKNLDIMIKFSEHFARREHFSFVRVDLYEVNNTIYFSEFTFAPMGGLAVITPLSFDNLLYHLLVGNNQTSTDYEKVYEYT